MTDVAVRSVDYRNFKALARFHLSFERMNLLVGPNNAGKSTIGDSLRLLSAGIRAARSRSPTRFRDFDHVERYGYQIAVGNLGISTVNVHTDYAEEAATATFTLTNGNRLRLYFPPEEDICYLMTDANDRPTYSAALFKRQFPITVGVVPVLGPLEPPEPPLSRDAIVRGLATRRASRHFRNYWESIARDEFDDFRDVLAQTWPGIDIRPPERQVSEDGVRISMFCVEDRIDREVYWAGFGFQVWCQLLTHLLRVDAQTLIAVDEAELYLHPDLQRQLVGLLRSAGPDVVLATHSTEIVAEADPDEVVLIDKRRDSAKRIATSDGLRAAFTLLGSNRNSVISQLARTNRALLVEGADFKVLRAFARKLGYERLATSFDFAVTELHGFRTPSHIRVMADSMDLILGTTTICAILLDRDYRWSDEIADLEAALSWAAYAHVFRRKELENYVLVPGAVDRALESTERERARREGRAIRSLPPVDSLLGEVTEVLRVETESQVVAKRADYLAAKRKGVDRSTLISEGMHEFTEIWRDIGVRLDYVSGKSALAQLNARLQQDWSLSLTPLRIVDAMRRDEIPQEMNRLIRSLDEFRVHTK